jgi:hypothetical protein
MQLSATEIAAKPLPFDLIPEVLSPSFTSSFQLSLRFRRHLPGEIFFACRGLGGIYARTHDTDFSEFKGCKESQLWMIRAGLGG